MRIISTDERIDVPYEFSDLFVEDTREELRAYISNVPGKGRYSVTAKTASGRWAELGKFDSATEALREMRRIRRTYEAGAKVYIIGTGDHDGPMEAAAV